MPQALPSREAMTGDRSSKMTLLEKNLTKRINEDRDFYLWAHSDSKNLFGQPDFLYHKKKCYPGFKSIEDPYEVDVETYKMSTQ